MAKLDLLLLCGPEANQRALAHKLAERWPGIQIIVVRHGSKGAPKLTPGRIARGLIGLPLRRAWYGMLGSYASRYPDFPSEPLLTLDNVNDPAVLAAVDKFSPRLAVVSGTNLLKRATIEAISAHVPILNLHTGISPYVKGAPNCTNWCLATCRFDLIGNSVMWIDAGIDSGNLAATEQTPLDGKESLAELHVKVMDHAHDLLCRTVDRFLRGDTLSNVPQNEIGSGTLYLLRQWNAASAFRATVNFYGRYGRSRANGPSPKLVG